MMLQFEQDEVEALGGDVTSYVGECPDCKVRALIAEEAR